MALDRLVVAEPPDDRVLRVAHGRAVVALVGRRAAVHDDGVQLVLEPVFQLKRARHVVVRDVLAHVERLGEGKGRVRLLLDAIGQVILEAVELQDEDGRQLEQNVALLGRRAMRARRALVLVNQVQGKHGLQAVVQVLVHVQLLHHERRERGDHFAVRRISALEARQLGLGLARNELPERRVVVGRLDGEKLAQLAVERHGDELEQLVHVLLHIGRNLEAGRQLVGRNGRLGRKGKLGKDELDQVEQLVLRLVRLGLEHALAQPRQPEESLEQRRDVARRALVDKAHGHATGAQHALHALPGRLDRLLVKVLLPRALAADDALQAVRVVLAHAPCKAKVGEGITLVSNRTSRLLAKHHHCVDHPGEAVLGEDAPIAQDDAGRWSVSSSPPLPPSGSAYLPHSLAHRRCRQGQGQARSASRRPTRPRACRPAAARERPARRWRRSPCRGAWWRQRARQWQPCAASGPPSRQASGEGEGEEENALFAPKPPAEQAAVEGLR